MAFYFLLSITSLCSHHIAHNIIIIKHTSLSFVIGLLIYNLTYYGEVNEDTKQTIQTTSLLFLYKVVFLFATAPHILHKLEKGEKKLYDFISP